MRRLRFFVGALLVLVWSPPLHAQDGTIRGRVTDSATQQPLVRAVVQFGSRGAITQADGRFVIAGVPAGRDSLRVRMIGYTPSAQMVSVSAGQTLDVDFTLSAQAVSLSEIVVTGYGQQRQGDITGAVSTITTDNFNTGRVVNPVELIANKAAGVQVVDNNEPGGGLSIRIRGSTSVNASNEPLYVVDGLPVAAGSGGGLSVGRDPLNALNPNDIASITVLRDASAAAIYGANAANGVILITTKRGTRGAAMEYSGSVSTSSITRRPDMLNAAQFRAAVEQYAPNNAPQLLNANTDWYDLVTQSAFGQDHNLAISNASETMNWRLSFGYLNQDGIIEGTEVERISLGFNFDQRLLENRLNIRANLKGSRSFDRFTPGGVISNAAQFGPTQPVFDENSQTGYYEWNQDVLQSPDNPLAILGLASDQATTYRSFGNVRADYRMPFLEALRANLDLGYDVTYAERETFFPSVLHGQQKTGNDGSDYRTNPSSVNGVLEAYLTYAAPLGAIPGTIDAAGGYSYAQQHAEYPWFLASGLSTDMLGGNGVVSARDIQNDQSIQESKLLSIFGRLNYNLNDRYLASLSLRRDGSSRFGEDNRWATFPAISIGWRLSEESFLKDRSPFSELKLRASWAKTGNQAFANYQQYSTYVVGDGQTQVQFGNEYVPTLRPSAVDPAIRWEETDAYNIGLDFAVMNSRLSGAIDWYTKNTDDLIFTVPVAAGTNLSNYLTTNIGSMKNRGIEFSLSYRLLEGRSGGLAWTTDFVASHNTNELTTINPIFGEDASRQRIPTGLVSGGVGTFIQVLQPGVPINSFFVFQHKRGPDGLPIYEDTDGSGTITTQDLYEDLNGDGTVNLDDRRPFHDPAPKWILGHSSYLAYGKFDLGLTLRAYLDNWVYNNVASNLGTYEEVKRGSPYNLHRSVLETGFETPQYLSDYYVEDASFLRLDNVTLGYSFTYGGRQMRAFGTVQSAFTITGYNGVDPTAGVNGLDNNIYPRSRTFTFGLGMRF